jgi:hypothetical protein
MNPRSNQVCVALLGASGAFVGVWALFFPAQFYTSFPGFGLHWVDALGPYNEHLARDVGGLYSALAVMSFWAAFRPTRERLALLGMGWLTFNTAHCLFHLHHLEAYGTADRIGNVALLVGVTVLACLLLVPDGGRRG